MYLAVGVGIEEWGRREPPSLLCQTRLAHPAVEADEVVRVDVIDEAADDHLAVVLYTAKAALMPGYELGFVRGVSRRVTDDPRCLEVPRHLERDVVVGSLEVGVAGRCGHELVASRAAAAAAAL